VAGAGKALLAAAMFFALLCVEHPRSFNPMSAPFVGVPSTRHVHDGVPCSMGRKRSDRRADEPCARTSFNTTISNRLIIAGRQFRSTYQVIDARADTGHLRKATNMSSEGQRPLTRRTQDLHCPDHRPTEHSAPGLLISFSSEAPTKTHFAASARHARRGATTRPGASTRLRAPARTTRAAALLQSADLNIHDNTKRLSTSTIPAREFAASLCSIGRISRRRSDRERKSGWLEPRPSYSTSYGVGYAKAISGTGADVYDITLYPI